MVQNYHVEIGQGEASLPPICVEFKHLRRSSRTTKRSYGKMQSADTGTSRRTKKPKPPGDECLTDTLPTDKPLKEPATDDFTNNCPTELQDEPSNDHLRATPTNTAAINTSVTNEPTVDYPDIAEALESSGMDDLPISTTHIEIEGGARVEDMSPTTHRAGYDILNEFFGQPAIDPGSVSDVEGFNKWPDVTAEPHRDTVLKHTIESETSGASHAPQNSLSTGISKAMDITDPDLSIASATASKSSSRASSETRSLSTDLTIYTPSETYIQNDLANGVQHTPFAKRSILDDPAPWLEHVWPVLEMDDTGRRPNPVPGVLDDILTNEDFLLCVKIMTSIANNWVECNRCIAKPAFDAAQKRSREVESNKFGLHVRKLTSEYVPRLQNQKEYTDEISHLGIRELVEIEVQKLLSDPRELTSEFKEESDYDAAINHIEKGNADNIRFWLRHLWEETYYWTLIQQGAKKIGPLPNPPGPKATITPQEKAAG
jgi:hypothetical protein